MYCRSIIRCGHLQIALSKMEVSWCKEMSHVSLLATFWLGGHTHSTLLHSEQCILIVLSCYLIFQLLSTQCILECPDLDNGSNFCLLHLGIFVFCTRKDNQICQVLDYSAGLEMSPTIHLQCRILNVCQHRLLENLLASIEVGFEMYVWFDGTRLTRCLPTVQTHHLQFGFLCSARKRVIDVLRKMKPNFG